MNGECVNCGGSVALGDPELCPTCLWHVRGEVIDCVALLGLYLRAWARFDEWCRANGRVAV